MEVIYCEGLPLVPRCVCSERNGIIFFLLVESLHYILGVIAEICATIEDLKDVRMVTYTILPFQFSFG